MEDLCGLKTKTLKNHHDLKGLVRFETFNEVGENRNLIQRREGFPLETQS